MKLTLQANVEGVQRQIDLEIEGINQVNGALRRLGKYLRLKAQQRFNQEGPGWPALKPASAERRAEKSAKGFEKKLKTELLRAQKTAKNPKTVERKLSILAEFRRLEAGGSLDKSLLTDKQSKGLGQRMQRAKQKSTRVLGRMASSIKAKVSNGTLEVYSEIPWSAVHNEGGSAGNGASIPQRQFLSLEDEDLDVLSAFILEEIEKKAGGG